MPTYLSDPRRRGGPGGDPGGGAGAGGGLAGRAIRRSRCRAGTASCARGTALPDATLAGRGGGRRDALRRDAVAQRGRAPGYRSPILALRKQFDLYANLRPTTSLLPDGPQLDFLIVRENTEGLYAGRERREDADTAIAERVITRRGQRADRARGVRAGARRAANRKSQISKSADPPISNQQSSIPAYQLPTVTIVHKANVLKLTDGLFREACLAVAQEYPDVKVEEMLVDAAAMWLAKDPRRFDVIVTTNLFGDILSDLAVGAGGRAGRGAVGQPGRGPGGGVRAGARQRARHRGQGASPTRSARS